MSPLRAAPAVAVGGAAGALGRYAIGQLAASSGIPVPWGTLAVNLLGCLLIGLLAGVVVSRPGLNPIWQPFVGIGVLGGFTTFSAFAADAVLLAEDAVLALLAYVAVTLIGGLVAVRLGFAIGHRRPDARAVA